MIDTITGNPYGVDPYRSLRGKIQQQDMINRLSPSLFDYSNFKTGLTPQEITAEADKTMMVDGIYRNAPELIDKWGWDEYGDTNQLDTDAGLFSLFKSSENRDKIRSKFLGMIEPAGKQFKVKQADGSEINKVSQTATVVDPDGKSRIVGTPQMLLAMGDPGTVLDNTANRSANFIESTFDALKWLTPGTQAASANASVPLHQGFVPVYDEKLGKWIYQGVVATQSELNKLEAAGQSIVNQYGPQPYSSSVFASMLNSAANEISNLPKYYAGLAASTGDLLGGLQNLATGNGFTSDYIESNAIYDETAWLHNTQKKYYVGSTRAQAGLFNNPVAFASGLGQGLGSMTLYGGVGKVANAAFNQGWKIAGALGKSAQVGSGTLETASAVSTAAGEKGLWTLSKEWMKSLYNNPTNLAMMGTGYMINGQEAYEAALEAGLSRTDASALRLVSGTLMSAVEVGFGANVLERYLVGARGGREMAKDIIEMYGGDLAKLDNPVNLTNIFQKSVYRLKKIGSHGALGAMAEEGGEEVVQGLIRNTNEWIYDNVFANTDVKGKGYFGTNPLSAESMMSYLEDATVGGLMGLGGGALAGRKQKAQSIIPFVARGDEKIATDAANYAFQQGALTETQRDKALADIQASVLLRDNNKDLFYQVAGFKSEVQGKISETLLKSLDEQSDFIKNTDGIHKLANSTEDVEKTRYEQYWNDLESMFWDTMEKTVSVPKVNEDGSISIGETFTLPIHTTTSFIQQLKESGRTEEAKLLQKAYKDAMIKSDTYVPKVDNKASDSLKTARDTVSRQLVAKLAILNGHTNINNKKLDILNNERLNLTSSVAGRHSLLTLQNFYEKALIDFQPKLENYLSEYAKAKTDADRENILNKAQQELDTITDKIEQESRKYGSAQDIIPFVDNLIKTANIGLDQRFNEKAIDSILDSDRMSEEIKDLSKAYKAISEQNKANNTNVGEKTTPEGNVETEETKRQKQETDVDAARNLINQLVDDTVVNKDSVFEYGDISASMKQNKDGSYTYTIFDKSRDVFKKDNITGTEEEVVNLVKSEIKSTIAEFVKNEELAYFNFDKTSADNLESVSITEVSESSEIFEPIDKSQNTDKLPVAFNKNPKEQNVSDLINSHDITNRVFSNGIFKISDTWEDINVGKTNRKKAIDVFNQLKSVDEFNRLQESDKNHIIDYLPITYTFTYKDSPYKTYLYDMSSTGSMSESTRNFRYNLILNLLNSTSNEVTISKAAIRRTAGYWNYQPKGKEDRNSKLNDIKSLQLVKENGKYYHAVEKDADDNVRKKRPLQLGIASRNRTISFWTDRGTRTAIGVGGPGTVYIIVPKELTMGNGDKSSKKDNYVIPLNPIKVSRSLAESVTKILSDIALGTNDQEGYSTTRSSYILPGNKYGIDVDQDSTLTIDQFLNYTVFEGARTMEDLTRQTPYPYLLNKTLRVVQPLGIIRYGYNEDTNDHYVYNPSLSNPTLAEDTTKFIDWMTTYKNMSIQFSYTDPSIVNENRFSVAGFTANKGDSYISWLVDNGIIQSDLNPTGTLLRDSKLVFTDNFKSIEPVKGTDTIDSTPNKLENSTENTSDKKPIVSENDTQNDVEKETTIPGLFDDNKNMNLTENSSVDSKKQSIIDNARKMLDVLGTTTEDDDIFGQWFKIEDVSVLENAYRKSDLSHEINQYRRMFRFGGNIGISESPLLLSKNYFDSIKANEIGKIVRLRDTVSILGNSGNPSFGWGVMTLDGIALYDGAIEGTLYHEAFHRVSLLYLNSSERQAIYNKAKESYGLANLNDSEIEEVLAEKFREYVLSEDTKYRISPSDNIIQKMFKSLRRFLENIKLWLNQQTTADLGSIEGLFNSIYHSAYRLAKPNEQSVEEFKKRYPNYRVNMEVPIFSPTGETKVTLNKVHDFRTLDKIVNALTALTLNSNNIEFIGDLRNKVDYKKPYGYIKTLLAKSYENLLEQIDVLSEDALTQLQSKIDMYTEIYSMFGKVYVPLINQKLNYMGLQSKTLDDVMSERENNNFLDNIKNDQISSAYEYSSKETASTNIKLLFNTLKDSSELDGDTYLPKYADHDVAWFNVMRLVSSSANLDEMLNRLYKEGEKITRLRYLNKSNINEENYDWVNMYSDLVSKLENASENMRTQFWTTFKKHHYNFVNAYFTKSGNWYTYSMGSSDILKRSSSLVRDWSIEFGVEGKYKSENREALVSARRSWEKIYANAQKGNLEGGFYDTIIDITKILNNIGIPVDSDTVIQATYKFDGVSADERLLNLILDDDKYRINYTVGDFLKMIFKKDQIRYNNKVLSNENYLSSQKLTRAIAEDYVITHPSREDDSVPGPEGNNVYAYAEHSFITQIFEEFVKNPEFLEQLSSENINSSSIWLRQLNDPKIRESVKTATILNFLQDSSGDSGRGYTEISDVEDTILKMTAIQRGMFTPPVLANKKTYHFIDGLKTHNVVVSYNHNTGNTTIDRATVDIFYDYFISERNAIVKAKQLRAKFLKDNNLTKEKFENLSESEQEVLDYSYLVENYHYTKKTIDNDKDGHKETTKIVLDGNGYNFRYFPTFTNFTESKLPSYTHPDLDINTPQYVKYIEDENIKISNIKNIIKKILTQRINDTIQELADLNIIKIDGKFSSHSESLATTSVKSINDPLKTIKTNIITENRLMDDAYIRKISAINNFTDENESGVSSLAMTKIIADYAVNTAISTIEFDKIVHGDVAFFKDSDTRVKRYSAVTSTGITNNINISDESIDTSQYKSIILESNIINSYEVYNKLYDSFIGTTDIAGALLKNYKMFRDESGERGSNYARFRGKTDTELMQMAENDAKIRLNGYLNTDQTDGAIIIHPKFFRAFNKMTDQWSDEREAAYNLLMSDKQLTPEESIKAYKQVVMQPLKLVYFGKHFENELGIPTYDKPAYFTIFKRMVKDTDLEYIYDMMDKYDIDSAQFQSATKSGNRQGFKTYDENNQLRKEFIENLTDTSIEKYIQPRFYKYLRKQLNTDPHELYKIMLGTQSVKIGVSGVIDDATYFVDNEELSGESLKQEWTDILNELTRRGADRLSNEWGFNLADGENVKINRESFLKQLQKESIRTTMPVNLVQALQTDVNGDYLIHPSAIPSMGWVQSKILSTIKKRVIDVNTPGNAMIQMSNYGFKNSDIEIIKLPKGQLSYSYGKNKELSFRDQSNRMEAIVSISLFKQFLPTVFDEAGQKRSMTYDEAREFILKTDLSVMGYRIPTQGQNSISALHIVDVLPESLGDIIVLPSEFTTVTGSDFDIDKLYVANQHYELTPEKEGILSDNDKIRYEELYDEFINTINWSNKYRKSLIRALDPNFDDYLSRKEFGRFHGLTWLKSPENALEETWAIAKKKPYELRKVPFDKNLENPLQDNSLEAIENRLLDIYLSVLTSENHVLETTTPLDASTKILKDAVKTLDNLLEKKSASDLELLFPIYQQQIKRQNVGANVGIGPMADANAHQVLTELVKLEFTKNGDFVDLLGLTSLHRKYDKNGISIMDWTSALINAHVDAAKDPYILKLNINQYTYSATTMMFRTGAGESTLFFMPQPILQDLSKQYMSVFSGKLGVSEELKKDNNWQKEIINKYREILADKISSENISVDSLPDLTSYSDFNGNNYILDKNWLIKQLQTKESDRDALWYSNQLATFEYFSNINTYGSELSNLIKATKIDTAKYGNSASRLTMFQLLVERMRSSQFFINPDKIYNDTFLGEKYNNSVKLVFDLFGKEFIEFSPSFQNSLTSILQRSKQIFSNNEYLIDSVTRELKTTTSSQFFKDYIDRQNYNTSSLFFGENSVVELYKKIINRINTEDDLVQYRGNYLLELLRPTSTTVSRSKQDGTPMLFSASVGKTRDASSMNEYTSAWRSLLQSTDSEIKDFANKLVLYGYFTSGGNQSGSNNFFNLVPFDQLVGLNLDGLSYNDYIKNSVNDGQNVGSFKQNESSAFRHLWYLDDMIPNVGDYIRQTGNIFSDYIQDFSQGTEKTSYLPEILKMNSRFSWLHSTGIVNGTPTYREYVQFNRSDDTRKQNNVLYRYIGTIIETTPSKNQTGKTIKHYPIYQLINKLGYSEKGYLLKEGNTGWLSMLPINNINKNDPNRSVYDIIPKNIFDPTNNQTFKPYNSLESTLNQSLIQSDDRVQNNDVTKDIVLENDTQIISEEVNTSPNNFQAKMTLSYQNNQRLGLISKTTFDAVKSGERTALTAYESTGNIDYWKQMKVGDTITFTNSQGETVDVVVTKPLYKLRGSGITLGEWSKMEGWSKEYFNEKVRPKLDDAWQIQYKLINTSKQIVNISQSVVNRSNEIITRETVRNNPNVLYLFGDNDIRRGMGGQAKEMRGEPNTIGISTKKLPSMSDNSFKTDSELQQNKDIITRDVNNAINKFKSGNYSSVVIPPLGVGLAKLPTKAPRTYEFLISELNRLEQTLNSTERTLVGTWDDFVEKTSVPLTNRMVNINITEQFQTLSDKTKLSANDQLLSDSDGVILERSTLEPDDYDKEHNIEDIVMTNMKTISAAIQEKPSVLEIEDEDGEVHTVGVGYRKNIILQRSSDIITSTLSDLFKEKIMEANKQLSTFKVLPNDKVLINFLNDIGATYKSITDTQQDVNVLTELNTSTTKQIYDRYRNVLNGEKYDISSFEEFDSQWKMFDDEEKLLLLNDFKIC